MRIRVNNKVRELLLEQAVLMDQYIDLTRKLSDQTLDGPTAIGLGSDREVVSSQLRGVQFRIYNASLGKVSR